MKEYDVTEATVNQWVKEYLQSEGINPIPEVISAPNDNIETYKEMSKEQLINELMLKDIEIERSKKRVCGKRRWSNKGIYFYKQQEFEIVAILSSKWPV